MERKKLKINTNVSRFRRHDQIEIRSYVGGDVQSSVCIRCMPFDMRVFCDLLSKMMDDTIDSFYVQALDESDLNFVFND